MLAIAGDAAIRRLAVDDIRASERFSHATRTVQLADGSVLEIDDSAHLSRILAAAGRPDAIVTRWQHSWRMVAASLVLSVLAAGAGYVWLLPVVADHLAARVPASWAKALDSVVIGQMERMDSLQPTAITSEQQQRLRSRFEAVVASRPGLPQVTVRFLRMGDMPNAFALPGGTIVFLDGIVSAAPDDDALVGVFAHELGHVQHRHGLRTLLRTAAVSAIAAWYFGDFTSLANAAVVASQLSYSREFETQADDTAVELMRTNRVNTKSLAELFRRMRDHGDAHDANRGDTPDPSGKLPEPGATKSPAEVAAKPSGKRVGTFSLPEFLSTHPDIERRIERFEKASAN
jgi:Zn-dependent protease with chaperone function